MIMNVVRGGNEHGEIALKWPLQVKMLLGVETTIIKSHFDGRFQATKLFGMEMNIVTLLFAGHL